MPPKRRNYEARFKLTVVDFAEKSNNSAAGRQFGVSEKLVRDWRKLQAKIKQLPKTKCADRGLKCHCNYRYLRDSTYTKGIVKITIF